MNNSKTKKQSDADKMIGEVLEQSLTIVGLMFAFNFKILWQGYKEVKTVRQLLNWQIPFLIISYIIVHYQGQLYFLHWLSPQFFHQQRLEVIFNFGTTMNVMWITGTFLLTWFWFKGIIPTMRLSSYQKKLDTVGLKNAKDFAPKVLQVTKLDAYRVALKILAPGIGIEKIKAKRDELQSSFEKDIEEINRYKNPKYVEVILSSKFLAEFVSFSQLQKQLTENNHFIVGETKKGVITQDISKLPHLLIAGLTGSGKSQFFKQLLTGILKSSDHLQMHLIDLKGGLEFKDFATLPNVKVAKTLEDSVSILKKIKKEMEARFDYLEEIGEQQINPDKHPFDRIILGIDEASVLYAQARRDDEDYHLICEARNLTEKIAKLGRAASINLILATQKVSKESIDTRIQENISGRICFKTGTLEGSMRVLGHGKASHLPATPGRAIWQFGTEEYEIQAPYLSNNSMKKLLQEIAEQYQLGRKKMKQNFKEDEVQEVLKVITSKPLTKEILLNDANI